MSTSRVTRSAGHCTEAALTQKRSYERHRSRTTNFALKSKVRSATSTVDMDRPLPRPHVLYDAKRLQLQRERQAVITRDNFILLKNLREIMHRRVSKDGSLLAKQKSMCIRTR